MNPTRQNPSPFPSLPSLLFALSSPFPPETTKRGLSQQPPFLDSRPQRLLPFVQNLVQNVVRMPLQKSSILCVSMRQHQVQSVVRRELQRGN